ncbi:hypothetical protein COT48_04950 [Candidatus Woesearchaeota archaeon CG08_land_8_20_14_0_20_47_9]|nr:MAG: hypothetical protein COT48_04950 [Candidatus Woesearchaeota archaeon CG08_land_8_20_14_0_20_47_9]HII29566.1 hypothetical protein [Candidatus Woesearchaeota archaeon]
MQQIFCFALGNIWRWSKKKNTAGLLRHIQKLDIAGVELTFSSKELLYNFKLTADQIKWLRSLEYVSIHAPFRLVSKADNNAEVLKQLEYVSSLYKMVNARNVIIHPDELPQPAILSRYSMRFSTENLKKKRGANIEKLALIFDRYQDLGFCLDVSHAYSWSRFETGDLVKRFSGKITQVHLSGTYRRRDHQSLRSVSSMFIKSIEPVISLNVPIVIEEDIDVESSKYLVEEISYIKSLFHHQAPS